MSTRLPVGTNHVADGVEIADVARTIRRQWRAVLTCFAIGVGGAIFVLLFAPRRFEGRASVLASGGSSDAGGSILGRLTKVGDLMGASGLAGLGSQFDSELQVLRSRVVAGAVVDSLLLQLRVRDPAGLPPRHFFAAAAIPGRFERRTYRFEKQTSGGYVARHGDSTYQLAPGQPGSIGIGTVTLAAGALPESFRITVYDREDAVTRHGKRIAASKAGGDVARIVYRGDDSITAAQVPNLVVATYLERRKTVDRGVNQRRLEYVTAQMDSTAGELSATERALRLQQEASGVFDAETQGEAEIEGVVNMRSQLTEVKVEEAALKQLLSQRPDGKLSARQIASYPAFMRAGGPISSLAQHINELEARRVALLERRTERDPEVQVIDENIRNLETQVASMAASYASSLTTRRIGLESSLDSLQKKLLALPAAGERGGRLVRDVERLTAIYTALQAQHVEARLAAIGEGGDVRQIDVAATPREPAFPEPIMTLSIGSFAGLLVGGIVAVLLGWFGRWLRDPVEIQRLAGVEVQRIDANAPLLLTASAAQTVLVVPLGHGARADLVAQRLARTATARSVPAKILDLSAATNGNGANPAHTIDQLELEGGTLVVQLPDLSSDTSIAALRATRPVLFVAPPGRVDRARLASALDVLRRLEVPCAGVMFSETPALGARG